MKEQFEISDDEQIIKFVKENECLWDIRHERYRDRPAKNQLWKIIGEILKRDHNLVKKRWANMRDVFKKLQQKIGTGLSMRDESLCFLENTSYVQREKKYRMSSSISETNTSIDLFKECFEFVDTVPEENTVPISSTPAPSPSQLMPGTDESLEFIMNRPTPKKKKTVANLELRHFCDSLYNSMLRLTPLEAAKIKLELSQVTNKFEVAHEMNKEARSIQQVNDIVENTK